MFNNHIEEVQSPLLYIFTVINNVSLNIDLSIDK